MKLISISKETDVLTARFNVAHNNGQTTVDQDLVLRRYGDGWSAEMSMEGFPEQKTATEAAHKLAEWFDRLAATIKRSEFDIIDLNNL